MIYIYGASGHAKVIVETLEQCGFVEFLLIDDFTKNTCLLDYQIVHSNNKAISIHLNNLIIAIGENKIRKTIVNKFILDNFINAIHPSAVISKRAKIGLGNAIMSNASINSGALIKNHCIINTNTSVDHDCVIEDFVHLSPNVALAGNVFIGEGAHVGIGVSIIQGIKIGKWCKIGAGAVIISDVPDYAVVVGNPGKIIKYNYEK
jgi:sugar O-acyltransferase (sialic acid O-acetyltransferase NeuD family)